MSRLTVNLIRALNRMVPVPRVYETLAAAKGTIRGYQRWEYEEIARIYGDFEPYCDLEGRLILDVGCGLGGKLPFYAEQGAERVIGIDLRPASALAAARLASSPDFSPVAGGKVRTAVADGSRLPFPDEAFDTVISVNVLEHVQDPKGTLRECRRVLRRGGHLLVHFPPFFSPWGPHVDGWINFPWPHLFFSERSLVEAAALEEARLRLNDQRIPSAQVDWTGLDELPELNRLTLRQFRLLLASEELVPVQCRLLPFGRHYLQRRGALGRLLLGALRAATNVPLLDEVIVTKIACVLSKEA